MKAVILQDDLGLNLYDFGARMYDPQIGRWHRNDPLSESYYSLGTYNFANNNPIMNVDLDGKSFWSSEYLNRYSPHWTDKQFGESDEKSEDAPTAFRNLYRSKNGGTWSKGDIVSYFGDEDESTEIIRANLSQPNAGELLLHNLRETMGNRRKPYLIDILEKSNFKGTKGWLGPVVDGIFSNDYSKKGTVVIAGKKVDLQIISTLGLWGKSARTQLHKYVPHQKGVYKLRLKSYAASKETGVGNFIIFDFKENKTLYNDVREYLMSSYSNIVNWTYKNPYE